MRILKTNTGQIQTNTYVVIGTENEAFVVDPGGSPEKIEKLLTDNNANCKAILLTHEHFDHCLAVAHFQRKGIKVYAHEVAAKNIEAGLHKNTRFRVNVEDFSVDVALRDGQKIDLCGLTVEVIHTPGHTSGSTCYKLENTIFSGDTLFRQSIGRTDLPTANHEDIISSIKNKLYILKDDCRILPGHEEETTLFFEKTNNKYTR